MRILQLFELLKPGVCEATLRPVDDGGLEITVRRRAHGMWFERKYVFDKAMLAESFTIEPRLYGTVTALIEAVVSA